jgi:cytochrome c556
MIRSLLKLAVVAIAAVLIYNYFFGTNEEKDKSRQVFGQMRSVVVSVADLVKSERAKFDAGKYDAALDKLGGAYRAIRQQAQHVDDKVLKRLDDLERRKAELELDLDSIEAGDQQTSSTPPANGKKTLKPDPKAEQAKAAKSADQQRRKEALQKELEALLRDSDKLLQDAQE